MLPNLASATTITDMDSCKPVLQVFCDTLGRFNVVLDALPGEAGWTRLTWLEVGVCHSRHSTALIFLGTLGKDTVTEITMESIKSIRIHLRTLYI